MIPTKLVPTSSRRVAAAILASVAATLACVVAFQRAGYPPCDLCMEERLPYYAAGVLAACTWLAARDGLARTAAFGFAVLVLLFACGAALGGYHVGVEAKWWAGPTDCTGAVVPAGTMADFTARLRTAKAVRCDEPAIRVMGTTMAQWNVAASLALAALATTACASILRGRPVDGDAV